MDLLLLSCLEQEIIVEDWWFCCLNDLVSDFIEEFLELAIVVYIDFSSDLSLGEVYVWGNEF